MIVWREKLVWSMVTNLEWLCSVVSNWGKEGYLCLWFLQHAVISCRASPWPRWLRIAERFPVGATAGTSPSAGHECIERGAL